MTVTIPLVIVMGVLAWVLRPREKLTSSHRLAMLVIVILPVLVAVAAVVVQLLHGNTEVSDTSNILFIVGLCLAGVAVLASAGFAIRQRAGIARVTGFSACIAIIVIAVEFGLLEWLGGV